MMRTLLISAALAAVASTSVIAQERGTFSYPVLIPEVALEAAQAALEHCRGQNVQVAVAVVDRGGNVQVLLRDRFAGAHTPDTAIGKAWTAVSFRTNTTDLMDISQPGQPSSGIRDLPGVVVLGGGVLIEQAGSIVGGIGVSGGPSGEVDDACAKAGVDKIKEKLVL
ncbi:GlcG/HbpS family heme-binding protein [Thioalkalivibrio sulfidiphilus]|uniref:GlcG/HbpS family heme-binding protein n=1 Tax=Thioalkalivibrio sulfidiphilus TaxID=1033854 RepID=UPI00037580FE|nr:heme-binding protein [Thioalkalivibrio sulfidiphilus]